MDFAPEVPASNADVMVRDTYQKWLNDCMTVHCIMRTAISDEFSCKFNDAQSKEILQILNKSFDTFEDLSSIGHRSSKREKKNAWCIKTVLILSSLRQTKVRQKWIGLEREMSKRLLDKVLI